MSGKISDRASLAWNLGIIVGSVLAMNGLIFGLGWADRPGVVPGSPIDPPGWLVGLVWTALFASMAVARWRLRDAPAADRGWVTALIVSCLAYPLYALAPGSMRNGFLGNLATIALAAYVVRRLWPASRPAAACVLPVIPWVCFATLTILADWGVFGPPG